MTDTTDPTPERPLDEVYDTQRDVEQDPYGAWQAIQTLSAERDALKAELVSTLSAAILDAQIRVIENRKLDTPDQIRANACAFLARAAGKKP